MNMWLLLIPLFVVGVKAQIPTLCECAIFEDQQWDEDLVRNPIPLRYRTTMSEATTDDCDLETNNCLIHCQREFDADSQDFDLCINSTLGSPRCVGSYWCEALHNQGLAKIEDGVARLYYRLPECTGTPHSEWTYNTRDVRNICCEDGDFSHCGGLCPDCVHRNLCECGMFAEEQFNEVRLNGSNPLPFNIYGWAYGTGIENFCHNWPSLEFAHPCDDLCKNIGNAWIDANNLNDDSPVVEGQTIGGVICASLYERWNADWPAEGITNNFLRYHARMPGCDDRVDGLNHKTWLQERVYATHYQQLCCDGNGERYSCAAPGEELIPENIPTK